MATLSACGEGVTDARAQLLVFVDTNALVSEQAMGSDNVTAFDSLRVDLLAQDGSITDYLDVVVPTRDAWPVSFGVAAEEVDRDGLLLRVRLFSSRFATRGQDANRTTLEPEPSASIDRVLSVDFPPIGVRKIGVFLDAECIGTAASFAPEVTSCVDREETAVAPERAFHDLETDWVASRVGTWRGLEQAPCAGTGPIGSVCVPGGFTLLGDATLAVPPTDELAAAFPFRPALLTPFWLDRAEFTVGQLRQLLGTEAGAGVLNEVALAKLTSYPECTWHDDANTARDDLPLNCISPRDAEAVCRAVGGQLPSEAQWEYAARGHGAGWLFPWGDQPPSCCQARVSRLEGSELEALGRCPGLGPTRADTGMAMNCEGADVSIDGAVDLAGNLMEATLDSWIDWSADTECWPQRGVLRDPSCRQDAGLMVGRGGDWSVSEFSARSTMRKKLQRGAIMTTLGFRCAYEDAP